MLGDGAVDAENDRLRFGREIRFTHRAFHTFDSDFRTIHDFGHKPSSLIRLALKLRRSTLTIQTFIFEAPYERHVFRNIAPTIVARLVAERSLDDHFPGWSDQRLQNAVLSKGDLTADLDVTSVHRDSLTDRFQPQHLRGRVFERVPFRGRPTLIQSPINWNIPVHSGGVDVHAGLQFDVEAQRDSKARPCDFVTGRGGDLKVLGFGCSSRCIQWCPKVPGQNVSGRDAFLIVILKVLGYDPPVRIDDIYARIRNTVGRRTRLCRFVENVVGAYDLRVRIREQRIRDVLPVRETLENADRVIADGRYTEPLLPDRVQMLFQLDELDLAERSPIRRTEEHQHGPFRAHDGFESLVPALLVRRGKSGYLLAHLWPGLDDLAVRRDQKSPHRYSDERSLCHTGASSLRT
jgi:hypothetical protein